MQGFAACAHPANRHRDVGEPGGFGGSVAVYPYTDENPAGHGNICQLVECTACGGRRNENRNQWHLEVSPWWDERGQRAEERRAANEEERANRNALAAIRDAYGNGPDVVLINDNYFGRSTRMRLAGWWAAPGACETARFPLGGRVGHGCTGAAITRETDVREDVGSGRGGGRDERADGAPLSERWVAVDGEGAADVADAGGPVRQRVAVGGRAATGGRYGGPAAGADAVHGVVVRQANWRRTAGGSPAERRSNQPLSPRVMRRSL